MTARALLTRRMLLKDMGKAGLAIIVLGASACSEEEGSGVTAGSGTSSADGATSTTVGATTTSVGESTTPGNGGHRWHRVNLDFVSAYILYQGGEGIIVDTGVAGSENAIEAGLSEVGLGWSDVGTLIVTHLHPDHQGSVPAILEATSDSLPWYAGAADLGGIEAATEGQAVGDGDMVNRGLEIIATPGHTAGHISVLDPVSGILVAGDAVNGVNGGVAGPNPDFSEDMVLANASVARLAEFEYEVALFGHGEPVLAGASAQVAALAQELSG